MTSMPFDHPISDSAMTSGICRDTVGGWLWYCDVHDSHGNADSEDEARAVAEAHREYLGDDDGCDLIVFRRGED